MSFRSRALPLQQKEDWRSRAKKVSVEPSELEKIAVTAPTELFGGAIGAIPGLAVAQKKIQPSIEALEKEARPEFLSSTGLEPAPEKGLTNLLALVGEIPGIEKYTPESLREKFEEETQGKFKPQTLGGRGIARGASLAGQAIPFGAGGLPNLMRIAAGGLVGQTLREKGAPEILASGAEILTPGLTAALGKKVPLTPEEAQLAQLGKKIGLSDQQMAAVLKSPKQQATFAKIASKGEKAQNLISSMFENLGDNYSHLKQQGREIPISSDNLDKVIDKWNKILFDLEQTHKPSSDKLSAIDFVKDVINDVDLTGSNIEKMMNLYQDINRTVNWNAWSGGKKQLAALKEPIKEVISKASPEIGKDFKLTNDLYARSVKLSHLLTPSQIENLLAQGHTGEIIIGIATLNPGILGRYFSFMGSREVAREILFSPRFNKMSKKMISAIKKNQLANVERITREFEKEVGEKLEGD